MLINIEGSREPGVNFGQVVSVDIVSLLQKGTYRWSLRSHLCQPGEATRWLTGPLR